MNAKINKVCEVVIKVCSIAIAIAQVVKAAFPLPETAKKEITQEQAELIRDFIQHEELLK